MDREVSKIVDFGDKLVSLGNFTTYIRLHRMSCKRMLEKCSISKLLRDLGELTNYRNLSPFSIFYQRNGVWMGYDRV